MYIKTYRYNLPVHQRTKLYACHIEKDSDDFQTLCGEVTVKEETFELKNISDKNWTITEGENATVVAPNSSIVLKKGMTINFGHTNAQII